MDYFYASLPLLLVFALSVYYDLWYLDMLFREYFDNEDELLKMIDFDDDGL